MPAAMEKFRKTGDRLGIQYILNMQILIQSDVVLVKKVQELLILLKNYLEKN